MITTPGIPQFGAGNSKLPDSTLTFALPSGFTCPGALRCLATADRHSGKLSDGPKQEFRCYEASIESLRPNVRAARWRNYELIRHLDSEPMAELLLAGIAARRDHKSTHVRWFTGGDCFSAALRDAIFRVCFFTPELTHYYYTKNLPLLAPSPSQLINLPPNLKVTASWGGKWDHLLEVPGLFPRTARVAHTRQEAEALGLAIDFDDRLAWAEQPSHFCHLTHGSQPAGSPARLALNARRRSGDFTGYGTRRVHVAPAPAQLATLKCS